MAVKIFLGLSVAIWLPYGLFCFFQPAYLTEAAGLTLSSTTASTEVRAMYGGLQAAIGGLALLGLLRIELRAGALFTLAALTGGLLIARLGGLLLDGGASGYTIGAIGFEAVSTIAASWLYRQSSAGETATAVT